MSNNKKIVTVVIVTVATVAVVTVVIVTSLRRRKNLHLDSQLDVLGAAFRNSCDVFKCCVDHLNVTERAQLIDTVN